MRTLLYTLTCAGLLLAAASHAAETQMRPGLWEVTTTSNLLQYASQIPPEQMQELKAMAEAYGLEMPQIQNGAALSKTCVTPEMAAQNVVPDSFQNNLGCSVKNIVHQGNGYRIDYACDNQQLQGNGVAEGTFTTPESFTGQTVFKGQVQGSPITERADIRGKWVNASCGTTPSN